MNYFPAAALPVANTDAILTARCGSAVSTPDGLLIVNLRENLGVHGYAEMVILTSDGRNYDRRGWHEGPEAEWVRFERYTIAGRVAHGWIDSVSRKLLQAG